MTFSAAEIRVGPLGLTEALLLAAVCLLINPETPEHEPYTMQAPVRGRWSALHSPGQKLPSHGSRFLGQSAAVHILQPTKFCPRTNLGSVQSMTVSSITGESAATIADSVRDLIARGHLRPGEALPPVRALAAAREVNRNTVATAYASLVTAGVVETRGRGGTIVRELVTVAGEGASSPGGTVNLADGNPDPDLLPPLPDLRGYSMRLYGAAGIDERLNRWAEEHIIPDADSPGRLVLTHGAVDAVERVLYAHLARGDWVAVEDPCFLSSIGTFELNGFRVLPVPVDDQGMTPSGLDSALQAGARAVVCTPRAHNPTGASITGSRASELRTVLSPYPEVLVIEDDHFSGLARTGYQRITPVSTTRWALLRSVSKFLGPDLRLGVTYCDVDTASRLQARLSAATWVSHILQHLVAKILTDPSTPALLNHAGKVYAQRREWLTDALTNHGLRWLGGSDGFNVWIPLHESEPAVIAELQAKGWTVRPSSSFTLTPQSAIRVTTSTMTVDQAQRFATDLATTLSSPLSTNLSTSD